jgi:hypothetical protein
MKRSSCLVHWMLTLWDDWTSIPGVSMQFTCLSKIYHYNSLLPVQWPTDHHRGTRDVQLQIQFISMSYPLERLGLQNGKK